MKIVSRNDDDMMQLLNLLDQLQVDVVDSMVDAREFISIIQGYQAALENTNRLNERMASAYTFVSVAASKLEGKI
jgi:hypothetical protein